MHDSVRAGCPEVATPNVNILASQLITQHACTHERVLQVQHINAAHECQIGITGRSRQVIHRAPADALQLGLASDGEVVFALDHGFALNNPALASARLKKSLSSVSWPILVCSGTRSTGSFCAGAPPKTSPARSIS